jgi:hypothetical protein
VGDPSKGLAEAVMEKNTVVSLKINEIFSIDLCVINKIAHPLLTMVAETASVVIGRSQ